MRDRKGKVCIEAEWGSCAGGGSECARIWIKSSFIEVNAGLMHDGPLCLFIGFTIIPRHNQCTTTPPPPSPPSHQKTGDTMVNAQKKLKVCNKISLFSTGFVFFRLCFYTSSFM